MEVEKTKCFLERVWENVRKDLVTKDTKGKIVIKEIPVDKIVLIEKDGTQTPIKNLPFEYKDFRIEIKGDAITKDIQYKLKQKFAINILETEVNKDTFNHYAELFEINADTGERVNKLTISDFAVTKRPRPEEQNKFNFWDPKIQLSVAGAARLKSNDRLKYGFDIGGSIMSYGKKHQEYLRVIRLGYMIDNIGHSNITFSPVLFNIGKPLPIFDNIWIIPSATFDIQNNSSYVGLGIGADL